MKLIVGLGNPGRKYEGTRHNIGFEVLRELARRHATGRPRVKFQGEVSEAQVGGESVLLLMPQTFMNLSGASVLPARDFYRLEACDVLVICDDFHLPLARLRFRPSGSAGGQKGLADILHRLGTSAIPRLRFGIGSPPPAWDVADYVLSKFGKDEVPELASSLSRAATAAADWVTLGTQECMNRYNADPTPTDKKKSMIDEPAAKHAGNNAGKNKEL